MHGAAWSAPTSAALPSRQSVMGRSNQTNADQTLISARPYVDGTVTAPHPRHGEADEMTARDTGKTHTPKFGVGFWGRFYFWKLALMTDCVRRSVERAAIAKSTPLPEARKGEKT